MEDKKKILVVAGVKEERDALFNMLKSEGHQVCAASSGTEGLEMGRSLTLDLVVLDALLPNMSGGDFIKNFRETPAGNDTFFIVISDREKMRDYFDVLNVDGFLEKPIDQKKFLETARAVFKQPKPFERTTLCKRVLVVGRYEECVQSMIAQLQKEDCHTDFVLFGEQVISKAVMFLPTLIIMESRMIDMSSNAIIRILRQMPQFKKVPILVYNYFHEMELKNSSVQQEELAMSFFVRACLDEGATESMGRYEEEMFLEKVRKYFSKGTIVVVDDDEGTTRLLSKSLEAQGYQVFTVNQAKDALSVIKRVVPKMVILDIVMPGVNGFELLDLLKKDVTSKDIAVMMLTVEGQDGSVQKALDMGADDYLVKPFNMSLLLKRVESILK